MIIKVLNKLKKRMDEHSEKSNKELEPNRAEEYNNWNNNTLEGINSRLDDKEEQISKLEDRVMEITQAELKKEKRI